MTYYEKLRDPRWQKRRLQIMERAKFACEYCFDDKATLNIHHILYRKKTDPWDYLDHELICLCERCHLAEEEARNEFLSEFATLRDGGFYRLTCAIRRLKSQERILPKERTFIAWCMLADDDEILQQGNEKMMRGHLLKWMLEDGDISEDFFNETMGRIKAREDGNAE